MKPRILIVDDDRAILEALSVLLEQNYETLTALDGEEALRKLEHEDVDAIVLDMLMPVIDGAGVLRALSERDSHLPVIVISAHKELQDRAESLGAADAISKPFDVALLERKISRVLRKGGRRGGDGGSAPSTGFLPGSSGDSGLHFAPAAFR